MSAGFKRTIIALMLLVASATATSGATYTASSLNDQGFTAAADFGVHVSLDPPNPVLRQSVPLEATASETAGGSITQVAFQRAAAGGSTWTTICTATASPYTCSWDTTTVANGDYDLRARATNQNGYSRNSTVVAGRLVDNASPSVTLQDPGDWLAGTKTLRTASVGDTGGSGLAAVRYEYKLSSAGTWSTACSASSSPWECTFDTTALTNGANHDFRAVARDGAGNETVSAAFANRRVDNANPSGTLTDPGTNRRGTVPIAFSASDAHSGVASVMVQYAPTGTGSWSTACADTTTPFDGCSWATPPLDGVYDLRAVVTDVTGNTFTTPTIAARRIDNGLPSVTMTSPAGTTLSGTITLAANATDSGSGMDTVQMQYRTAGAATWGNACGLHSAPPYSCTANSTGVPDGLYDFRAVGTDVAGNIGYGTLLNRRIDNFAPSAADVQTANGGATPGVIEAGDTMTLTYSEQIDPTSIIAGWDGTGSQSIYVAFSNHNGQGDRVQFHSVVDPFPELVLAAAPGVRLNADYVPSSGATFAATLTQSGPAFTITLGALLQNSVNGTAPGADAMTWSSTSGCRDFVGKACSTTQRTETGGSDREF